ncbi:MAG: cupredoxin domain-containing protein [Chloroflexi bacterium]|nr:cupredoxin domain-containing protein [Chloroflexota bacterium]
MRAKKWLVITLGVSILALGGTACGSAAKQDPTPVKTFKITPAATTPTPVVSAVASAAVTATASGTASGAGDTELVLVALNIQFDKKELTASAGTVKLTIDNKDNGIPHNLRVYKGTSVSGQSVGATPVNSGPAKDTLTFQAEAGAYFYHCDVHPNMSGTLTVQ